MTEKKLTPKIELLKGSFWLAVKVFITRKVIYTRCTKCGGLIRPLSSKSEARYPSSCPHCGAKVGTEDAAGSYFALRVLGAGFLLCIIGLIVLSALDKGQASVFSHLSCVLGGFLASSLGLTVKPPAYGGQT